LRTASKKIPVATSVLWNASKHYETGTLRLRQDYARRLKTLNGLTPYDYICKT
jgi:hypothetical protein